MDKHQKYKEVSCKFLYNFSEGLAVIKKGGKFGYIDRSGEIVIASQYDFATEMKEGLAAVKKDGKYGYIDKNNNVVVPFIYEVAVGFSEGLAAVRSNGKFGFIDHKGNVIIDFLYGISYEEGFSEGYRSVCKEGKWSFVNKTGKEIVPFEYDYVGSFHCGLAAVKSNGKFGFIDHKGNVIIDFLYDGISYEEGFSEGYRSVCKEGKWSFVDKTGKEIAPFEYDYAGSFHCGLAAVIREPYYGYINTEGKVIVPFKYEETSDYGYDNDRTYVREETDVWHILDKEGQIVKTINDYMIQYEGSGLKEGLIIVCDNGKMGAVDINGDLIIPCTYDSLDEPSGRLIRARKGGLYGFIDHQNKNIIPFMYTRASSFYDGFAEVWLGKKRYMIDEYNNIAFIVKKETELQLLIIKLIVALALIAFILYNLFA